MDKSSKTQYWLCSRNQDPLLVSPIVTDQGLQASTDVQKAEVFNEYYNLNTPLITDDLPEFMSDLPVRRLSELDRAAFN